MKKLRRRTPAHKVNRKQRADAIKALASIVRSDVQPYVKAKAAAALLNNGREPEDDNRAFARDPNEPRKLVVLPDKGNDPGVRFGIYEENQVVAIIPAGYPADHEVQPEESYAHVPKPIGVVAENALCRARAEARRACYCESLGEPYDPMKPLPFWPWPATDASPEWRAEVDRRVAEAEAAEAERQRARTVSGPARSTKSGHRAASPPPASVQALCAP